MDTGEGKRGRRINVALREASTAQIGNAALEIYVRRAF